MPTDPIIRTVRGDDFTPRFTQTTTVVASPVDATETIIATITLSDSATAVSGIELIAFAAFTIGTTGTAGNLKIRRTNAAGTTIAATGLNNVGVWAATQLAELYVAGFDTGPTLPGQVYVATLTITGGAAASTISALYLRALTVQPVGAYEIGEAERGTNWVHGLVRELHSAGLPLNTRSNVYEASRLVKGGPGYLIGFTVYNSKGSAQFVQFHDSAVLPAEGAAPEVFYSVATVADKGVQWLPLGRAFQRGIYVVNSSTGPTKTIGSADCWFDVQFIQPVPIVEQSGGGGGPLVGCLLGNSANVDVHAAATVPLTWDTVYDGLQNFTPLPGLPAGLGLTVDLTGVSPAISPTVTGTWALGVQVALIDGADATFKAYVTIAQSVAGILLGPTVANDAVLTAGASMDCVSQGSPGGDLGVSCTTTASATANPYRLFVLYSIVRLA